MWGRVLHLFKAFWFIPLSCFIHWPRKVWKCSLKELLLLSHWCCYFLFPHKPLKNRRKIKKNSESLSSLTQSLRNWISFVWKKQTSVLVLSVGKFKVAYNDYLICFKTFLVLLTFAIMTVKTVCLLPYLELGNLCESTFLDLSEKIGFHFSSVFPLNYRKCCYHVIIKTPARFFN